MRPDCEALLLTGFALGAGTYDVTCDFGVFWKEVDGGDVATYRLPWPKAVGEYLHKPGVCAVDKDATPILDLGM